MTIGDPVAVVVGVRDAAPALARNELVGVGRTFFVGRADPVTVPVVPLVVGARVAEVSDSVFVVIYLRGIGE